MEANAKKLDVEQRGTPTAASLLQWVASLSEFEVVRRLGVGAYEMAMECRPRDAALAREVPAVAVKILLKSAAKDYRAEGALLARLSHPNVVRMFGVKGPVEPTPDMLRLLDEPARAAMMDPSTGQPRPTLAAVMEFCPHSLKQYLLLRRSSLTAAQLLRMCWELLQALRYLWGRRLVHLNIKTDNLLVAADGRLVLSDFCTAKEVDANGFLETSEPIYGNLEHLAPEVIGAVYSLRNVAPGKKVRVPLRAQSSWECGTTMHEVIAGAFPYAKYPAPGPSVDKYAPLNPALLASVHPALAEVTLALIRWPAAERMTLDAAHAKLEPLMQ